MTDHLYPILEAVYAAGMPYAVIAKKFNIPKNTVASKLRAGRLKAIGLSSRTRTKRKGGIKGRQHQKRNTAESTPKKYKPSRITWLNNSWR
jgi:transposase